jgi:L-ascorbate metabolism protein UlaG (beta-lactamase superfamily)
VNPDKEISMRRLLFLALLFTAAISPSIASAEMARDTLDTDSGPVVIHPINHATFVMQHGATTIYVDPVGEPARFTGFAAPDLVLLTHVHGDHTSAESLAALSRKTTTIIAPASVSEKLGDAVPGTMTIVANGESTSFNGVRIDAVPAYNLSEERQKFHPRERGDNAYVVTIGGTRIFISGDTEGTPEMRALDDIDAAFVCMNLPYTMAVEQAADAVLDFAPTIVYPYHYRGTDGMSDLDRFETLVSADPAIEVRRLKWY